MPPHPLPNRSESVAQHFPTAITVDDFIARVETVLSGYGFTGENSIGEPSTLPPLFRQRASSDLLPGSRGSAHMQARSPAFPCLTVSLTLPLPPFAPSQP